MEEDVASCIIHFDDVSNGILRQFTAVSLSKFIHCRNEWLSLTGAQNEVAVNSLEYFTDLDEEAFSSGGTIPQRGLQYHIENLLTRPKLNEHNVRLNLVKAKSMNPQQKETKKP
jgi:hypothetical protein